jgi:hypothetical protein
VRQQQHSCCGQPQVQERQRERLASLSCRDASNPEQHRSTHAERPKLHDDDNNGQQEDPAELRYGYGDRAERRNQDREPGGPHREAEHRPPVARVAHRGDLAKDESV